MSIAKKYYRMALGLAIFTILYNLLEGIVSTYLGYEEESLVLFGFGSDSFIEVISGIGIIYMIMRIWRNPESNKGQFERAALRITGFAFYLLVLGLVVTSFVHIWTGHHPVDTFWGIIISVISIMTMLFLVVWKRKVGAKLNSAPILADSNCTLLCVYMSVILLLSSGVYQWLGFGYIDSLGTLGLSYFAYKEGKECFEKANKDKVCCE